MSATTLLQALYRHKAWADEALLGQLEKLDPAMHEAERHAAIRVLNHIHVVDRIFAGHLRGEPHGYTATNTPETPTLAALREAVLASNRWYLDYVGALPAPQLTQALSFTFTDGAAGRMSREEMLGHVITHGSYHRGAIGRILAPTAAAPAGDTLTVFLHRAEPQRRERA